MLAGMLLLLGAGCFHAPTPYLPRHWPESAGPLEVMSDTGRGPAIQVIIAYNSYWPNHTALRMVDDAGKTLFWDPAGGYGKTEAHIVRRSDLITENAPDLATYMVYRWANNDQAVEIFEWRLTDAEARRLADALIEGAGRTDYTEDGFRTATAGLFCNAAVSGFLYDYGHPSVPVGDYYLLPNLLSRELYTRRPDRVLVLKRASPSSVLVLAPPHRHHDLADRDTGRRYGP